MGTYAIFDRRSRSMHSVPVNGHHTVCGLPIGIGTGLVRDGNYAGSTPCPKCWELTASERVRALRLATL